MPVATSIPVQFDPLSVPMSAVGDLYDVAFGYADPTTGNVRMVGYCLTPTGQWTEATNMQDENHLVQIASPASSDKFTRFPKVSQGDWSGGERQLIFINGNQFWQSQQIDTSIPGHLKILGWYRTITIPNGVSPGVPSPRVVAASFRRIYFLGLTSTVYYVSAYDMLTGNVGTAAATGMGVLHELMRNSDYPCYVGAFSGIWTVSGTGTTVTLTPQVTNDNEALINGASMATFAGSVYYITGASSPNAINSATYPLPGAGAGTTVYTGQEMEHLIQALGRGATGLVFVTGASSVNGGIDQFIYAFDGSNANFLGRIEGSVRDICEANGTVYILTFAASGLGGTGTWLPVVYSVSGSTVNVFDDFRKIDPAFWPIAPEASYGHIESDGQWLYLWYSGLSVKRYSLTTSAISDIGNPLCVSSTSLTRAGTPLGDGSFVEIESAVSATTAYICDTQQAPTSATANASLITSWYDFGTPDVDKSFKSIEFAFNTLFTEASLAVNYELDNPNTGYAALDMDISQSGLTLEGFMPAGTIGKRIRFQITWSPVDNVDVQSYSTLATLARIWTFPVSCRHNPQSRLGADQQGLTAMQLLANIINAYTLAAGKITMWIPDPTATPDNPSIDPITGENVIGVSQVQAIIQDYSRTNAPGVSPAYHVRTDDSQPDLDGDCSLTIAESLG